MEIVNEINKEEDHHVQLALCETRPAYRQGRKLTAVKVYTINSESQHLFIYGVPKINLRNELKSVCAKYGRIRAFHVVTDYKTELFTECYHVQYERIQSARIAKKLIDNKAFYGGVLHVCYTPEYEQLDETRQKLQQRSKDVLSRLEQKNQFLFEASSEADVKLDEYISITKSQIKKKRKFGDAFKES
ncbi:hypothetical protein RN001_007921 [Aquatica leii]|uniref:RNA-binding protein 48 n=1 Tax=Aquatica leii TaxID=1421715 RepID=A0AAN7P3J3_9COLE|nr:hypothetical protein RN001_007921 [Aquatica leii]